MRHKSIITAALLLTASACSHHAGRYVSISAPAVDTACDGLTITRVELTDSSTRVHFHLICDADSWVNLESSAHITSKGICYPMIGHEGLTPDRRTAITGNNRELDFTLIFSPLPPSATEFNFLEGRAAGSWCMLGVRLDNKTYADTYARN
ncbi:MAG: hypothetical protein K2G94_02480 [Muribaculaceae bacterium]|nr:hypothetical protein [Muribaculaceae bacterium]MDE5959352.1 hypothetical protein [Muribaculaceae bacterium]MDE5971592.1 hypothetical protein [Muribaculaceae bacterium]